MLLLFADPDADHHDNPPGHPECPERVLAALEGIRLAGLNEWVLPGTGRAATRDELTRVHTGDYVDQLARFCSGGGGMIDNDTWAGPGSYDTALAAAGGGIAAIDQLSAGAGEAAFVALRPPGHHARPSRGMGFCLFNNVAVAAAELVVRGERVVIVDWDVHHGNGTQEIFWDESAVLYISAHQSPLYPGTGAMDETGGPGAPRLTLNLPVPRHTTGEVIRRGLEEIAGPVIDRFHPTWVLVSAGFDAHRDDPLAGLALSAGDFADLAGWVRNLVPAPGRLVLFLEGGYELGALSRSVGATLAALAGTGYRPEPSTSGGPGAHAIEEARHIWNALDG